MPLRLTTIFFLALMFAWGLHVNAFAAQAETPEKTKSTSAESQEKKVAQTTQKATVEENDPFESIRHLRPKPDKAAPKFPWKADSRYLTAEECQLAQEQEKYWNEYYYDCFKPIDDWTKLYKIRFPKFVNKNAKADDRPYAMGFVLIEKNIPIVFSKNGNSHRWDVPIDYTRIDGSIFPKDTIGGDLFLDYGFWGAPQWAVKQSILKKYKTIKTPAQVDKVIDELLLLSLNGDNKVFCMMQNGIKTQKDGDNKKYPISLHRYVRINMQKVLDLNVSDNVNRAVQKRMEDIYGFMDYSEALRNNPNTYCSNYLRFCDKRLSFGFGQYRRSGDVYRGGDWTNCFFDAYAMIRDPSSKCEWGKRDIENGTVDKSIEQDIQKRERYLKNELPKIRKDLLARYNAPWDVPLHLEKDTKTLPNDTLYILQVSKRDDYQKKAADAKP